MELFRNINYQVRKRFFQNIRQNALFPCPFSRRLDSKPLGLEPWPSAPFLFCPGKKKPRGLRPGFFG
jgi:hypothetical protein